MAFTRKLEPRRRQEVQDELGIFLRVHPHPALNVGSLSLGISFEVYSLPLDGLTRAAGGVTIADCLVKTGNWQHQILLRKRAKAVALSSSRRDIRDSTRIAGLVVTPLAAKIDRAIKWIDLNRPEDRTEVYFFIVPAFQIHAFLLGTLDNEDVFVVSNPAKVGSLKEEKLYKAEQFLAAVNGVNAITGIVMKI
jgi:hypothetical protein